MTIPAYADNHHFRKPSAARIGHTVRDLVGRLMSSPAKINSPNVVYGNSYKGYFHDSLSKLNKRINYLESNRYELLCNAPSISREWRPKPGVNYSIVCPFNAPDVHKDSFCNFIDMRIAEDINSGVCRLFLDNTNEKCHPSLADLATKRLLALGVSNCKNLYLLCQDRNLQDRVGITVLNHDYFIIKSWDAIANLSSLACNELASVKTLDHISHTFLCLNATPRPIRVLTLVELIRSGIWGSNPNSRHSLVSFPGFRYEKEAGLSISAVKRTLTEAGYEDVDAYLDWIDENSPFIVDAINATGNELSETIDTQVYCKTISSIVTETECQPNVCRFTEKTFKALALGHLPIVIGNQDSLSLAKSMGFDIFDSVIDQSYDVESRPLRRVQLAIKAASKLLECIHHNPKVLDQISEIATANIKWARTGFANCYVQRWTDPIINQILFLD